MGENRENEKLQLFAANLLLTTVFHPIEYAKTLARLGYEPLEARQSKTLLGYPAMIYPNIFHYVRYIKSSDGFFGCFTGLSPIILGIIATTAYTQRAALNATSIAGYNFPEINEPPNIVNDEEPNPEEYIKLVRRDLILSTAYIVIYQPFDVMSTRMMASFIGKDEQYRSLFSAAMSILDEHGIFGFFHGLIPKLIGNAINICMVGVLAYYVNKFLLKKKEQRELTKPVLILVTGGFTYPFFVVSTCMAVSGSSLKAGNPPNMENYRHWMDCWWDLSRKKQTGRGGAVIYRVQ